MAVLALLVVVQFITLSLALPVPVSLSPLRILKSADKLFADLDTTNSVNEIQKNNVILYEYYDETVLFPGLCDDYCSHTYPVHTYPEVSWPYTPHG